MDKYIDTLQIKRMGDKEYDINCNFVMNLDVDKLENDIHKTMSLKGSKFYIKNTILWF